MKQAKPASFAPALVALVALVLLAGVARGDAFSDVPIGGGRDAASPEAAAPASGPSASRIGGSLAAVVALIVVAGFAYRRVAGGAGGGGGSVVRLVGRSVLTPKHQVMVLQVGRRLVVVGDAGHGMQPLCEVTDPEEVTEVLVAAGVAPAEDDPVKAGAFAAEFERHVDRPAAVDDVIERMRKEGVG